MRRQAKYKARRARRILILRVVRAAIRHRGVVFSLPPPARHWDVMQHIWEVRGKEYIGQDQGFVLSDGRYVGRKEAHRVAKRAGQINGAGYREPRINDRDGSDLFSEDVW